jgi:hypothetical protein
MHYFVTSIVYRYVGGLLGFKYEHSVLGGKAAALDSRGQTRHFTAMYVMYM